MDCEIVYPIVELKRTNVVFSSKSDSNGLLILLNRLFS